MRSTTYVKHVETFIAQSHDISIIALSFVNDLVTWKASVLKSRSEAADFLNDSIIANAKIFASLAHTDTSLETTTLDAIFDL